MDQDTQETSSGSGSNFTAILTAIQGGVTAVNNMTQAIKLIFPSSS